MSENGEIHRTLNSGLPIISRYLSKQETDNHTDPNMGETKVIDPKIAQNQNKPNSANLKFTHEYVYTTRTFHTNRKGKKNFNIKNLPGKIL